jgi:hypothetical protein
MFIYRLQAQCFIQAFRIENEGQVPGEGKI